MNGERDLIKIEIIIPLPQTTRVANPCSAFFPGRTAILLCNSTRPTPSPIANLPLLARATESVCVLTGRSISESVQS